MVNTYKDIRIFKKQLDFKYNSEELSRHISSPLRLMKNKNNFQKNLNLLMYFQLMILKLYYF